MIGAGVFVAYAPAARAAGAGLLVGLVVAAAVAFCNATSSAQLAAVHPESGGTYVYATRQLSRFWGYLAGFGFVVGKLASLAAMGLTFGAYAAPSAARPLAVAAVVAAAGLNYVGVEKTARATRLLVVLVLASLALAVGAVLAGTTGGSEQLTPLWPAEGARGVLQAAGFLFFAFAGYARIATLGEEVVDPERTIPRAIPLALGITVTVYAAVGVAVLLALGPSGTADAAAPVAAAVGAAGFPGIEPVVRAGAVLATFGVLLSLLAGVSRTVFAMASAGDLPRPLAAVHPRFRVPHRAEVAVAAVVVVTVTVTDVRDAIGFSSFAVLVYYALTNLSALRLGPPQRRYPRALGVAGVVGCVALAAMLPLSSVVAGTGVLLAGAVLYALSGRLAARARSVE